jgi:metal-responsive CopG/Arc/MetJ family transcriptional regulator
MNMADETKDISVGTRIPPSWAKEMNLQMQREGCAYASEWLRDAVREKLDRDNSKLCEKEEEYVTISNLKQKMKEILRDPKFKEEVFRD